MFDGYLIGALTETGNKLLMKKNSGRHVRKQCKWFSKSLVDMKRDLLTLSKKIKFGKSQDINRGLYFTLKNKFKKAVKLQKMKYKESIMDKLSQMENSNPKMFWQLIRNLRHDRQQGNPINLDIWEKYYKCLSQKIHKKDISFENKINDFTQKLLNKNTRIEVLDREISENELMRHVSKLKCGKSAGEDRISNEMLKYGGKTLQLYILKLFNGILKVEKVPQNWGSGLIIPIPKTGDKNEPDNYRGITLSNSISKFFNLIMNRRLVSFLEDNNILCKEQIGFRQGSRTTDHIFVMKTIIQSYKLKRKPIYSCFIDLRKAFDSVWRNGLFYKLLRSGISTKLVKIITDLYNKTYNRVFVEGHLSNSFKSWVGTRQGCNLSPTIFNIYLNDLPNFIETKCDNPIKLGNLNVNLLMYADDIILLSKSKSGLQKSLDACCTYFNKWKLEINTNKTKILIFNQTKALNGEFYYGKQQIKVVTEYKYLGLIINSTGSFKSAVSELLIKAKRAYACLYQSLNIFNGAKPITIMKAFDTIVTPIMLYGSEIWTSYTFGHSLKYILGHTKSNMEKFHTRVCKNILGVNRWANNVASRSELGRYPIAILAICNTYKYYLRLQCMPEGSLLGEASLVQKSLYISKQKNIYSFVEMVCRAIGHPLTQAQSDLVLKPSKIFSMASKLKSAMTNMFRKIQNDDFEKSGKLELLAATKHNIKYENYLDEINKTDHRRAMTKIRISCHNLPVERGRKLGIPRHRRSCHLCTSSAIGDEFHIIMECPNVRIQSLRVDALSNIITLIPQFKMLPMNEKYIYAVSCCDISCTKIIAPYIHECLKIGK